MGSVAVFDSGLGSLSVALEIGRAGPADVVYYADTEAFPYGAKGRAELRRSVSARIEMLRREFSPSLVVVGSVTPTLLLPGLLGPGVAGVLPPVAEAAAASPSGRVAVLATRAVASDPAARAAIARLAPGAEAEVVDASALVALAESGAFLDDPPRCAAAAREALRGPLSRAGAAALSSTHLSFLRPALEAEFPGVAFADPAPAAAREALARAGPAAEPRLRAFTSGDPAALRSRLARLGVAAPAARLP